MKDLRIIEEVLSDHKGELQRKIKKEWCPRREESLVDIESPLAQVVIGVRRSGKSTMCYNVIRKSGKEFAYVNFDDDRMLDCEADDLNNLYKVLLKLYGKVEYLFLDEIQNVEGWHLFVNRLLWEDVHILLTGSNARLLSGELATHLTGRHTTIELYPFSFSAFCYWKGLDTKSKTTRAEAAIRSAFDEYLAQGGFPELLHLKNSRTYVDELVRNILVRDIEQRYKIRYAAAFERLSQHLLNISPVRVVYKELQEIFKFHSAHTVENYVNYLSNAYVIRLLPKYSTKSRLRQRNDKAYAIDVAFMDRRENAFSGENLGWRLETLVYLELSRRYRPQACDLYYYSDKSSEVDFVVCKGNQVQLLVQVSYDISTPKTRKRELSGFVNGVKQTGCRNCLLITDHEYGTEILSDGTQVNILPAYDYFLDR